MTELAPKLEIEPRPERILSLHKYPRKSNARIKIPISQKKVFTTGDVSKLCFVAPRTVSKWCDSGRMKSYKLVGSLDRRVARADLIQFMRNSGMPLGDLTDTSHFQIYSLGFDTTFNNGLDVALLEKYGEKDNYEVGYGSFSNAFLFGGELSGKSPEIVLLDFSIGGQETLTIAESIRQICNRTAIIGVVYEDMLLVDKLLDESKFQHILSRPIAISDVIGVISRELDSRLTLARIEDR